MASSSDSSTQASGPAQADGPGDALRGRRVLVIGASSGVGRASGLALAGAGARVAFAARRRDRVEECAATAGAESIALECDVIDEGSVGQTVEAAAAAFGGLDALVYAPGIGIFERLMDIEAADWRELLNTNLVGPSIALRAAMPHLETSRGKVVLISSIVIDDRPPRPQNAPYVVSKIALESLAQAWQGEHHAVGFTTIAMGDTITEFGQQGDPARLIPMVQEWIAGGYMYGRAMDAESVAEQVLSALRSRETVRRIAITPRYSDDPADGGGTW